MARLLSTVAGIALFASNPAIAQDRNVLPVPMPAFDGTMPQNAMDARPGCR